MHLRAQFVLATAAAAAFALPARAAERVTLRTGSEQVFDRHEMVAGKYRFYFKKTSEDFIDFTQSQIASIEKVPDPPPEPDPPPVKDASATVAAAAPKPAVVVPAKLTQADLHQMLATAGNAHNVDEDLLASVVKAESGGNVHAVSPKGAQGLMQLMPGTAAEQGVQDAFRPADNVRGGAGYLDWLLQRYHDNLALALAAYNAGPGAVDKYHGIPPFRETQLYVARVIHEFNRRVKERAKQTAMMKAQVHNTQPADQRQGAWDQ
jgi:hypothetical protein